MTFLANGGELSSVHFIAIQMGGHHGPLYGIFLTDHVLLPSKYSQRVRGPRLQYWQISVVDRVPCFSPSHAATSIREQDGVHCGQEMVLSALQAGNAVEPSVWPFILLLRQGRSSATFMYSWNTTIDDTSSMLNYFPFCE